MRQERGLSLREASRRSDGRISSAYLSQLETSKRTSPGLFTLTTLAEAYEVSVLDILDAYGIPVPEAELAASRELTIGQRVMQLSDHNRRIVLDLVDVMNDPGPFGVEIGVDAYPDEIPGGSIE